jgi:superfamily II DNA/RNA helicase
LATEFVLKLLKKRLFSSPAAFSVTIEKHAATVGTSERGVAGNTWQRQLEEAENDFADDEDYEQTTLEALENASSHAAPLRAEEKALLTELREFAATAASHADSKASKLIKWLQRALKPSGEWSSERVIIFTEYRATQKWLHDLLAASDLGGPDRLLTIYGGMPLDDRERIKAAFQASPIESSVRILLATDAASEGLNLQNHCWQLIHYEIPWNPNRMEQRNGRVDRHGQKQPKVHVYHFVGEGFDEARPGQAPGDLEGDLEFLLRAALKTEVIREDLGKVGPVIASQVEEAMLGRRRALDTARAERESQPVRALLKFERKLREQLEKLAGQLQDTQDQLRLSPENIHNVVVTGLALAAQPPLRAAEKPGAYYLPALTGSWSMCADGLAHPHSKKSRPIVFDHALAAGRDDVVLCHLNHRLVRMCLRLLRAEIWSQEQGKKINRFTTRMVSDSALRAPAVLIHGRLLVLGGDTHRIHEEIITAGGQLREGRFSRMNVGETEAAAKAATSERAPKVVEERLKALWTKSEKAAQQALEARMHERTKNLQSFLDERVEREVANATAVMRELERSIREALAYKEDPQLRFDWSDSERQQRERDIGSLQARLLELPNELKRETDHLRERYRDPQPRLFPVAVTFFVPPRAVTALQQGGGE